MTRPKGRARRAGGSVPCTPPRLARLAWTLVLGLGFGFAQPVPPAPQDATPAVPLPGLAGVGEEGWAAHVVATPEGDRPVAVFAPQSAVEAGDARPALVLVLHGNGGSGMGVAEATGFAELAAREGFVAAFPDALGGSWNYVRGVPGYPEEPDDAEFLTDLARDLERLYGTDPRRRYVAGYSNGGFMAQRLACDAPELFAAFVSVSAAGFAGLDAVCPAAVPASVALMHGTSDDNVPWNGLPVEVPGGVVHITWPVPTTFAWWAERAECALPAARTELAGNAAAGIDDVIVFSLEECADGRVVALYGLRGGGHAWPRSPGPDAGAASSSRSEPGGPPGFDATLAAWAFLRSQTLPER